MSAGKYKLNIDRAATFRFGFRVLIDAVPYDLTDSTFTLYISDGERYSYFEKELIVEDDLVLVELTPEETEQFSQHRTYHYTIDMVWPSEDIERILEGRLYVNPSYSGASYAY